MYLDYSTPANRSPNSSRPGYPGAGAFQPGLSLPRQPQRPFDMPLGSSALYSTDRLQSGYNPRVHDQMGQATGLPPTGYLLDAGQGGWNYGPASVATVNGAMNGASRQRNVNRRAALPSVGAPTSRAPCNPSAPLLSARRLPC